MTKNRRKSDVHALKPRAQEIDGRIGSKSRRQTIAHDGLKASSKLPNSNRSRHHGVDEKENELTGASFQSMDSHQFSMTSARSPSKKRSDAGFFFRNLPNTPLRSVVASARKKSHQTPSFAVRKNMDTSYLSNSSDSSSGESSALMADLKMALDSSNMSSHTLDSTSSKHSTSHHSSSSSSSGSASDVMNRSILSDTTDLTASNFVLAASSKQCLLEVAREVKQKRKREEKEARKMALQEIHIDQGSTEKVVRVDEPRASNEKETEIAEEQVDDVMVENKASTQNDQMNTVDENGEEKVAHSDNDNQEMEEASASKSINESKENLSPNIAHPASQQSKPDKPTPDWRNSSMLGASPANVKARVQASPKSLRKLTESLKRNRLQRQLERDRDTRNRLSMGGSNKPPSLLPPVAPGGLGRTSIESSFSVGHAFARRQSAGSVADKRQSFGSTGSDSNQSDPNWNLSSRLAQSPFDSSAKESQSSVCEQAQLKSPPDSSAKNPGIQRDGYEDTTEINFDFDKWIRAPINAPTECGLETSVRTSRSAVALRRLSKNDHTDDIGGALGGDNLLRNPEDDASNDGSTRKPFSLIGSGSKSLASSSTTATKGNVINLNQSGENESSQRQLSQSGSRREKYASSNDKEASSMNSGSVLDGYSLDSGLKDSAAMNSSNSAKTSSENIADATPNTESKELIDRATESSSKVPPREISIAFSSQDDTPQAQNNVTSPVSMNSRAESRQAPGSASKLTPTRLSKRPRRIPNPDSLNSPARNTRSATKARSSEKKAASSPAIMGAKPGRLFEGDDASDTNVESRASLAPTVASKGAASRSSTASYSINLDDILGSEFDGSDDEDDRRTTADFSIGALLGGMDDHSRRSSIATRTNKRRSSMFRSSLSSLPEDAPGLGVASSKPDDSSMEHGDNPNDASDKKRARENEESSSTKARDEAGLPLSNEKKQKVASDENGLNETVNSSTSSNSGSSGDTTSSVPNIDDILGSPTGSGAAGSERDSLSTSDLSDQGMQQLLSSDSQKENSIKGSETSFMSNQSIHSGSGGDTTSSVPNIDDILGSSPASKSRSGSEESFISTNKSSHSGSTGTTSSVPNIDDILGSSFATKSSHSGSTDTTSSIPDVDDILGSSSATKSSHSGSTDTASSIPNIADILGKEDNSDSSATDKNADKSPSQETEDTFESEVHYNNPTPMGKDLQRRSILNSAMKKSRVQGELSVKKTRFKSPEAAEYEIGSTSRSLTPMPKGQAKALFAMPSASSGRSDDSGSDMSFSSSTSTPSPTTASPNEESQAGNNSDMSMSSSSSTTSPANSQNKEFYDKILANKEETVTLEYDMNQLMSNLGPSTDSENHDSSRETSSVMEEMEQRGPADDTATMELETSIGGLLATACGENEGGVPGTASLHANKSNGSASKDREASPGSSIAASCAPGSVTKPRRESNSAYSSSPSGQIGTNDERTMDLEVDMGALLGAVDTVANENDFNLLNVSAIPLGSPSDDGSPRSRSLDPNDSINTSSSNTPHQTNREETVELENNVEELFDAALDEGRDSGPNSSDDNGGSHSFTAKLEDNMAMVLQANSDNHAEFDVHDTPGGRSLRSRRSSISSHRLSLEPEGRQKLFASVNSSEGNSELLELSEGSAGKKYLETFDMGCNELFNFARLDNAQGDLPDAIVEFVEQTTVPHSNDFNIVMLAVCEELEAKIDEYADPNERFEGITNGKQNVFLELQENLRRGDAQDIALLEQLSSVVCTCSYFDWSTWLATVLGALKDKFDTTEEFLQEAKRELAEQLDQIDETKQSLFAVADASARRARRKSMNRRKNKSSEIEAEIRDLEQQIASLNEGLENTKVRNAQSNDLHRALTANLSSQKDAGPTRFQAMTSRVRCKSLQGIVRWEALERQTKSRLSYKLVGAYPETSASLTFEIHDDGARVLCRAKLDPSVFQPRANMNPRLSRSTAAYVKKSCGDLLRKYTSVPLQSPSEIGSSLMTLDWLFGRLENLASELAGFETDDQTTIFFANGGTSVEMELSGCLVTAELHSQYPFKPMSVRIDVLEGNEIDIRGLQRHLVKHAKPGHQYLTRFYECLKAYLTT